VTEARRSVALIADEVSFGWLVRGCHAWGADLLVAFMFLHVARAYWSHGYARPRQWTWVTGVGLLVVMLTFAFTGSLLPWDQYAYWSTDAARRALASTPAIGTVLLALLWGGWELGQEVLQRFYALHAAVLPWVAALLLGAHLWLVAFYGLDGESGGGTPLFPDLGVEALVAALLVGAGVATLATVWPPPLSGPADPSHPPPVVVPRWYFQPLEGLLRHVSGSSAAVAAGALLLMLLLLPVIDGEPMRSSTRRVARWLAGAAVAAAALWFGVEGSLR